MPTAALVAAALHFAAFAGGEGRWSTVRRGFNARRVLEHGEWGRCGTALVLHASLAHAAGNAATFLQQASALEARRGPGGMLATTGAVAALACTINRETLWPLSTVQYAGL